MLEKHCFPNVSVTVSTGGIRHVGHVVVGVLYIAACVVKQQH
jgi:hypothetical protein